MSHNVRETLVTRECLKTKTARRIRWIVPVFAVGGILFSWYIHEYQTYRHSLLASDDVFSMLVYYLETHRGEFPPSEEALLGCAFVQKTSNGFHVRLLEDSQFRMKVYSVPMRDFSGFNVKWGCVLASLVENNGKVVSVSGNEEVLLMTSPLGIQSSRDYTKSLLQIAQSIRTAGK